MKKYLLILLACLLLLSGCGKAEQAAGTFPLAAESEVITQAVESIKNS